MKNNIVAQLCGFRCILKTSGLMSSNNWMIQYLFFKNYVTSDGAVSHNVLYYQQLSIARHLVSLFW